MDHPIDIGRKMSVMVLLELEEMESLHARQVLAHRSADMKAIIQSTHRLTHVNIVSWSLRKLLWETHSDKHHKYRYMANSHASTFTQCCYIMCTPAKISRKAQIFIVSFVRWTAFYQHYKLYVTPRLRTVQATRAFSCWTSRLELIYLKRAQSCSDF